MTSSRRKPSSGWKALGQTGDATALNGPVGGVDGEQEGESVLTHEVALQPHQGVRFLRHLGLGEELLPGRHARDADQLGVAGGGGEGVDVHLARLLGGLRAQAEP